MPFDQNLWLETHYGLLIRELERTLKLAPKVLEPHEYLLPDGSFNRMTLHGTILANAKALLEHLHARGY